MDMTIDPWGIYHGPPLQQRVGLIKRLTMVDANGFRWYRMTEFGAWQRLRTDEDLRRLNEALPESKGRLHLHSYNGCPLP